MLPSATIFELVATAASLVMEENPLDNGSGDDVELPIISVVVGFRREFFGCLSSEGEIMSESCLSSCVTESCFERFLRLVCQ